MQRDFNKIITFFRSWQTISLARSLHRWMVSYTMMVYNRWRLSCLTKVDVSAQWLKSSAVTLEKQSFRVRSLTPDLSSRSFLGRFRHADHSRSLQNTYIGRKGSFFSGPVTGHNSHRIFGCSAQYRTGKNSVCNWARLSPFLKGRLC